MYGNNCSDYDFVSHCGNRGVHLDSGENRTAYYVHHGESVPCCVSVPVHVRCGRVLLHSYQKLLRVFVPICSAIFLLSVPAYADEVEASQLNIEVVEHELENVSLAKEEASEINNLRLGEILNSPSLRSTNTTVTYSASDGDASFTAVFNIYSDALKLVSLDYDIPEGSSYFELVFRIPDLHNSDFRQAIYNVGDVIYLPDNVNDFSSSRCLFGYTDSNDTLTYVRASYSNFPPVPPGLQGLGFSDYLENVGEVFSWLLATIGTLIAFILGNPFLAVSLLLFLAGTVISFYIRIKNA